MFEQIVGRRITVTKQAGPDTGRAGKLDTLEQIGQGNRLAHLHAHHAGLKDRFFDILAQVFQHQHKLVAAQSPDGVALAHLEGGDGEARAARQRLLEYEKKRIAPFNPTSS